jgi:hypothetical protein
MEWLLILVAQFACEPPAMIVHRQWVGKGQSQGIGEN